MLPKVMYYHFCIIEIAFATITLTHFTHEEHYTYTLIQAVSHHSQGGSLEPYKIFPRMACSHNENFRVSALNILQVHCYAFCKNVLYVQKNNMYL